MDKQIIYLQLIGKSSITNEKMYLHAMIINMSLCYTTIMFGHFTGIIWSAKTEWIH